MPTFRTTLQTNKPSQEQSAALAKEAMLRDFAVIYAAWYLKRATLNDANVSYLRGVTCPCGNRHLRRVIKDATSQEVVDFFGEDVPSGQKLGVFYDLCEECGKSRVGVTVQNSYYSSKVTDVD